MRSWRVAPEAEIFKGAGIVGVVEAAGDHHGAAFWTIYAVRFPAGGYAVDRAVLARGGTVSQTVPGQSWAQWREGELH